MKSVFKFWYFWYYGPYVNDPWLNTNFESQYQTVTHLSLNHPCPALILFMVSIGRHQNQTQGI